jgi:cytochrome oxidase Cu insertion factor (SCO1/SenC/PrrC family)
VLGFAALALVGGAGVAWFRRAFAVALPENRAAFVAVWALGAALGIAALLLGAGWVGGIPAALAILAGSFFLFTVAISAQKGGSGAFQVGAPVPDFGAPDDAGDPFELSSLAGRPLLLKFFRGHW